MDVRKVWDNAYYRWTMVYISIIVTLIFCLQIYRFFFDAPSSEITCPTAIR